MSKDRWTGSSREHPVSLMLMLDPFAEKEAWLHTTAKYPFVCTVYIHDSARSTPSRRGGDGPSATPGDFLPAEFIALLGIRGRFCEELLASAFEQAVAGGVP